METKRFQHGSYKLALAALFSAASASMCAAQANDSSAISRPVQTVTAGQGGYVVLPDLRSPAQSYALTGDAQAVAQSQRAWQSSVGPMFRVGQGSVVLPMAR